MFTRAQNMNMKMTEEDEIIQIITEYYEIKKKTQLVNNIITALQRVPHNKLYTFSKITLSIYSK